MITQRTYIRDGRAPIPENENISRTMSAIKDRNTKPELILRGALWHNGIKGYRLHWKKVQGRPDIAFPGKRIAVFVNGCYWHRCPHCNLPLPKSNVDFWKKKFEKNTSRDKRKLDQLHAIGWKTVTIWECQVNTDLPSCVEKVKEALYE